jgi:hypothetical protein
MSSTVGANDPTGSRFTVTREIIDTLYKLQPQSEVGLVVFRDYLYFDTSSHNYFFSNFFKTLSAVYDSQPNQAYIPFLTLNRIYMGYSGKQILDSVLSTTTSSSNQILRYVPNFNTAGGTNINVAFLAAREAIVSANNPKSQQYIIFLSDGEPSGPLQAGLDPLYFSQGIGIPATFTIFFTNNNTLPSSLVTMTTNIKANGYSASNPQSAVWSIQTSYNVLLNLLMTNVINLTFRTSNPVRMVMNNVVSTIFSNGSFVFPDSFFLSPVLSPYSMIIDYQYTNPVTGVLTQISDSTVFYVKPSATATTTPGITFNCSQSTTPPVSIPVIATFLDTNNEGHLDRIALTWTDTATIRQNMPAYSDFFSRLQITSINDSIIPLHGVQLVYDPANKRISVILSENSGQNLETGWQSALVELANTPMTVSGRYFQVNEVLDGAGPVISEARYFSSGQFGLDSILVTFSEPVVWQSGMMATPNNIFIYFRNNLQQDAMVHIDAFSSLSSSDLYQRPQSAVVILRNNFLPQLGNDYLQLVSSQGAISDAFGNIPGFANRRVQISLASGSKIIENIGVGPQMLSPDTIRMTPTAQGMLICSSFDDCMNFYLQNGGIFIAAGLYVPADSTSGFSASIKIASTNGHVVHQCSGNQCIERSATPNLFGFYWNGYDDSHKNEKVCGGDYNIEITILANGTQEQWSSPLYVNNPDCSATNYVPPSNSGCGKCGTGTGLAFIPPVFFYARCHLKKVLKKKQKRNSLWQNIFCKHLL